MQSTSSQRPWRFDPAQSVAGDVDPRPAPLLPRAWPWWLGAAALLFVLQAGQRVPCEPSAGVSLTMPAGAAEPSSAAGAGEQPTTLRLASFNIHGGKGTDGQRDLDRIAALLTGAEPDAANAASPRPFDLVGLQEVHGAYIPGCASQAQCLGEKLGLAWLFAPSVRQWGHYEFGNGLLAGAKVTGWQTIPLPQTTGNTYHNAVLVTLPLGRGDVRAIVTHVHRKDEEERVAQLRTVLALFESLAAPAVLLGDLNTTADDPQLAALLKRPDVRDAVYAPLGLPTAGRIDWIITRGLRTKAAGVTEAGASDHPRLWAEVELAERELP